MIGRRLADRQPRADRQRRAMRVASALVLAAVASMLVVAAAAAHPLGNFTINHYAGLTIAPDRVGVDIVIDKAEIPAFQDRQDADTNGDGTVSDQEASAWAAAACAALGPDLQLVVGGRSLALVGAGDTISFPPGAGGLSTLRLECVFAARLGQTIAAPTTLTFADTSFAERIGWREIVATGDGTALDTNGLPATSPSQKLTAYPASMIAQPLDIRSATIGVRPGVFVSSSDAASGANNAPADASSRIGTTASIPAPESASVPGGVAGELPAIISSAVSGGLNPLVLLGAILAAIAIGAFHAVTPGHGKTVVAAYLVGSRGSALHAVGLGLSVAVSHTMGILVLALVIVAAERSLPPDVVIRTTPVIAAVSIVAIGGWMLIGQVRQRRAARTIGVDHHHPHADDADGHGGVDHHHPHADDADGHGGAARHLNAEPAENPGEHRHGGGRPHRHAPLQGTTLTWRSLFALGLTGGLVPSTSALFVLVGAIVAGRTLLGLVLVVAFGVGMAAVMTGVGLAMVFARSRLDRVPRSTSLGRFASVVPLLASIAVVGIGLVLTWTAVAGRPAL